MKTIMLIFGTRPEAIKMAPLVKALSSRPDNFRTVVAVTGQHREMLDQVLRLFEITPDFDLNIMKKGQDLTDVTCRILTGMRDILKTHRPDLVLVHGDTSTSTAAALSAFYEQIPVGHVEAGLRTGDIYSPWPEEMNRRITGRIATFHFAPTDRSRRNLRAENVDDAQITVTGNTVIDALHAVVAKIDADPALRSELDATMAAAGYDVAARLADPKRRLVLMTGHRRENFGDGFRNITLAIKDLAERYPDVDFVYPMHLNPNVRRPIAETFGGEIHPNVFFIEPLDYLPFVYMMKQSYLIITDSGGIQEEAPSLGKPVLVMREVTERPEALDAGTIRLVGTDRKKIVEEAARFLDDPEYYARNSRLANPYGDGKASERIISFISANL
ncbi:MAG: UDP-N-acetylglucosamine 2-epimerase (non-hydrolyzing) [Muribaculaceae bacterium]|nr:UDP-N-acetylglucosamine 2-epimerase (non-hydrolyzing) [Muribaculaceae bacterium]